MFIFSYREELREQYEGKLSREMSGMFYEVFSRVMRVLVGKKITVPGTFKRCVHVHACIFCCTCMYGIGVQILIMQPGAQLGLCSKERELRLGRTLQQTSHQSVSQSPSPP